MAIFHCTIKNGGRSKGQSAVAAAAYRSGEKLNDYETGIVCDYSAKRGIVYSEISLCDNAPKAYANRETLWNEVHKAERAKDARIWREAEVAIPREFTRSEQIDAVREYVKTFTEIGMCADWSIHDKGDGNPHAHIMLTTRPIKADGQWGAKEKKDYARDENGEKIPIIDSKTGLQKVDSRNCKQWKRVYVQVNDWNAAERVEEWRKAWADTCNSRLKTEEKIDHRSFARQGISRKPTIHEGFAARAIEKKGGTSERCEENRAIKLINRISEQIKVVSRRILNKMKKKPPYFVHSGDEKNGDMTDKMVQAAADLPHCWQILRELDTEMRACEAGVHSGRLFELRQDYGHILERAEYSVQVLVDGRVIDFRREASIGAESKEVIDKMVGFAIERAIPAMRRREDDERAESVASSEILTLERFKTEVDIVDEPTPKAPDAPTVVRTDEARKVDTPVYTPRRR